MNRIFHARILWHTPILLVLLTIVTVWSYWNKQGIIAFITLALMFLIIERAINTTYTLTTDNRLIIHRGRFFKDTVIPLADIHRIERIHSACHGTFCLKRYLLIHYGNGKIASLIPAKEEELYTLLLPHLSNNRNHKKHNNCQIENKKVSRFTILFIILLFPLLPVTSIATESHSSPLSFRLDSLLTDTLLARSEVGLMVYDLDDDTLLYSYQADKLYRPASIQKVMTAVTALEELGPDHSFNTTLYHTGVITPDSLLKGNLYVVGGFDPLLNHLDMEAFAQAVAQSGIRHIEGKLIGNAALKDSLKWGSGWCWDDGMPILTPLLSERTDSFLIHLRRALLMQGVSVADTADILVAQAPDSILTQIAVCRRPLTQIMDRMMKNSDNLHAEAVFYQLASNYANQPYATARDGARMIGRLICRVGHQSSRYSMADGSGVSLYNYLSPCLMTDVLRHAYRHPAIYRHLKQALPIAGIDGTLKNRMKKTPAYRRVYAKTGTLTGVISLAGYAIAANGHTLAFVIINQNILTPRSARAWQDKVCTALCQ